METHGPLGVIWVGLGLIAFYLALVWINLILLPHFLTPLFIIPFTWLMDAWQGRKRDRAVTTDSGRRPDARVETPNKYNVGA